MKNFIITIGREFCSGGAETGKKVAEYFGVPYYDKVIIDKTAEMLNFSQKVVADNDEKSEGFWYSFNGYQYNSDMYLGDPSLILPIGVQIADAQFDVIKELADKGPCVIIGRCSNVILADRPDAAHIFIKASRDSRIRRAERLYGLNDPDAEKLIKQTDKVRSSYYAKHTGEKWGSSKNYDLIIDASDMETDAVAKVIEEYIKAKFA